MTDKEWIRAVVKKTGMGRPAFARRVNVPVTTLTKWMYDKTRVPGVLLPAIKCCFPELGAVDEVDGRWIKVHPE